MTTQTYAANPIETGIDVANLVSRIEKLEKKNRKQRFVLSVAFAFSFFLTGLSVCQFMGFDVYRPKAVRAQAFYLQDADGAVKAELITDDHRSMLAFYGDFGVPSLSVAVVDGEPGVHVYDRIGTRRAVFGVTSQGPNLYFMNVAGRDETGLIANERGNIIRDVSRWIDDDQRGLIR